MITLVLLPGMDGTGCLFADFVSALGPEFETILVRYPTHEPLGYNQLEGIAREFLPCDRPFILLGESFSGPIAISLSASAPPGLAGLILCCSFASGPQPLFRVFRSLLRFIPIKRIPVSLLCTFLLGRFSSGPTRSALRGALDRVSAEVLKTRIDAVLEVDVSGYLARVRVPVLYLRASEDHLVPRAASHHISRSFSQLQVVDLVAPHFLLQALPSEAADVVRAFSRQVLISGNYPFN